MPDPIVERLAMGIQASHSLDALAGPLALRDAIRAAFLEAAKVARECDLPGNEFPGEEAAAERASQAIAARLEEIARG